MAIKLRNIGCFGISIMVIAEIYFITIVIKSFYEKDTKQVPKNEVIDTTHNVDKELKQLCDSINIDYNTVGTTTE
jgi:hypothetical protein